MGAGRVGARQAVAAGKDGGRRSIAAVNGKEWGEITGSASRDRSRDTQDGTHTMEGWRAGTYVRGRGTLMKKIRAGITARSVIRREPWKRDLS